MITVPDTSSGRVRWLTGRAVDSAARPRFQAVPGPKPVLGLAALGPGAAVGSRSGRRLRLPDPGGLGPARLRRPGHPGDGQGGGGAPGLPPGLPGLRQRRRGPCRRLESLGHCWAAAPLWSTCPWTSSTWASLRSAPTGHPSSNACWRWRRKPPGSSPFSPNFSSTGPPSPAGLSFSTHSPTRSPGPPLRVFRRSVRPAYGSAFVQSAFPAHPQTQPIRSNVMSNENDNQRNGNSPNGHGNGNQRNGQVPANGVAKNGNGHHGADVHPRPRPAVGLPARQRHRQAGPAPGRQPGLPAQGPGQPERLLPGGPHRHRPGQPHLRPRRLGPRGGRRGVAAGPGPGEHPDRRGPAHPGLLGHGEGHRPRRSAPHRRGLPAGGRGDGGGP